MKWSEFKRHLKEDKKGNKTENFKELSILDLFNGDWHI